MRGRVLTSDGDRIAGAAVIVRRPKGGDIRVTTNSTGEFEADVGKPATVEVHVKNPGYKATSKRVKAVGGKPAVVTLRLAPAATPGILRGSVRTSKGKPLRATVRVDPIGVTAATDANGDFALSLPPGSYQVLVSVEGYVEQRRPMKVKSHGSDFLSVVLRKNP